MSGSVASRFCRSLAQRYLVRSGQRGEALNPLCNSGPVGFPHSPAPTQQLLSCLSTPVPSIALFPPQSHFSTTSIRRIGPPPATVFSPSATVFPAPTAALLQPPQTQHLPRYFSSTPRQSNQEQKSQEPQKLIDESSNQSSRPRPQYRSGPVTWGSLGLLVVTGAGLLWYFEKEKQRRLEGLKKVKSIGKAALGGPIKLINEDGKPATEEDFKGKWNLLYFGFTFCPDICPAELEKLAAAIDILEKKHKVIVQPVFISIDPERDTPEQVKAYIKEFHPKMVGLTGTVDSVKAAAREFRVYYMKTEEEGDDYLVDHSIIMYLMDPKWEFVKFYGRNHSPDSLADGIASEMQSWGKE